MASVPCSACKRRTLTKHVSVYTARFSEQERIAYRTKLCHDCAAEYADTVKAAKPIFGEGGSDVWPDNCSMCGGSTADDLDPIYLTVYEPKREGISLTIPSCAACTSNLAPMLERFGQRLVDRVAGSKPFGPGSPGTGEGAPSPLAWA